MCCTLTPVPSAILGLCNVRDLTGAWPRNGRLRGSDDGSPRGILVLSGSNHTWSGSAMVRAGKQSFLLSSPGDTSRRQTLSYFSTHFGGPDSREQLRALDTYGPIRTVPNTSV